MNNLVAGILILFSSKILYCRDGETRRQTAPGYTIEEDEEIKIMVKSCINKVDRIFSINILGRARQFVIHSTLILMNIVKNASEYY